MVIFNSYVKLPEGSSLLCGSKMEDIRVAEWFLVRVLCEGSTSMMLTLVALYA